MLVYFEPKRISDDRRFIGQCASDRILKMIN